MDHTVGLHSDLVPYVRQSLLGHILHHPLVISIMVGEPFNESLNAMYESKKDRLQAAKDDRNWSHFIMLHERPYRAEALHGIAHHIESDREYWELVHHVWLDSENIRESHNLWYHLWGSPRQGRLDVLDQKEKQTYEKLPQTITVWRGVHDSEFMDGFSWSLNREKAKWFACRFEDTGFLVEGRVTKDDVITYIDGRGESEIVVLPERVNIIETVEIT